MGDFTGTERTSAFKVRNQAKFLRYTKRLQNHELREVMDGKQRRYITHWRWLQRRDRGPEERCGLGCGSYPAPGQKRGRHRPEGRQRGHQIPVRPCRGGARQRRAAVGGLGSDLRPGLEQGLDRARGGPIPQEQQSERVRFGTLWMTASERVRMKHGSAPCPPSAVERRRPSGGFTTPRRTEAFVVHPFPGWRLVKRTPAMTDPIGEG